MNTEGYETVDDVVWIGIGELSVDEKNIRNAPWGRDGDEDLVKSVEKRGIDQPVTVRPIEHDDDGRVSMWGIVAGSRRYNAAIDAGLNRMPCRIRDYDDTEAMLHSMDENRSRSDSATWRDIEFVGETIERLSNDGETVESAKRHIKDSIGVSRPTINRYHKVFQLPEKTRALLRESEDLSPGQRDYFRSLSPYNPSKLPLKISTLEDVWTHMSDWAERDQVRAAFKLNGYSSDDRSDLAERWADEPETELESLVRDSSEKGAYTRMVTLEPDVRRKIGDAAVDRHTPVDDLMAMIIRKWVRANGYYQDGANGSLSDFRMEGSQ